MIPKIIHYIWLGEKKTKLVQKSIKTWKKKAPEYKIMEWNEETLPSFKNSYYQQAMATNNYAFASDYARLKVLQKYGGLYLDTDMYLLKNPTKLFKNKDLVFGINTTPPLMSTCLIAASRDNKFINEALDLYSTLNFEKKANPYLLTPILEKMYGFKEKDRTQFLDNRKVVAYNSDILLQPSFNAVAMHVGDISWQKRTWHDQVRILMRSNITTQFEAGIFRKFNDMFRKVI